MNTIHTLVFQDISIPAAIAPSNLLRLMETIFQISALQMKTTPWKIVLYGFSTGIKALKTIESPAGSKNHITRCVIKLLNWTVQCPIPRSLTRKDFFMLFFFRTNGYQMTGGTFKQGTGFPTIMN